MSPMQLPPYFTPAEIGKACGMPTRRARFMLDRAGILERLGERWVTAESRLRERLPDVYERVWEKWGDVTREHLRAPGDT